MDRRAMLTGAAVALGGAWAARSRATSRLADLPVEQPTRFEFVVNRKAAQAIGMTLPQAVLLRADEVIG